VTGKALLVKTSPDRANIRAIVPALFPNPATDRDEAGFKEDVLFGGTGVNRERHEWRASPFQTEMKTT